MANINDNKSECQSQNAKIAAWMLKGKSITALEALEMFGCFRLASRIHDLRTQGYDITVEKITLPNGKLVASYRIDPQ